MSGFEIVLLILVAVLAILGGGALLRSRGRTDELAALRQEIQSLVSSQGQAITGQIGQFMQAVTQQLGQVRQELQSGVAASGQLTSQAQREVSQQLQSATEAVRRMSQQIGEVQQHGQQLSAAALMLQNVLGGAKTRGTLGEFGLERMLQDALPQGGCEVQFRFSNGNIVDAVVRSGERVIPIDSKFPLEAYLRLVENGEDARKEFAQAVRKHADSIAEKYILPDDHTLDIALMFVPSEAIYYELLMTEDPKAGRLDGYCRGKSVIPVSPNTLYAYLSAILMGLRGMQVEENARRLLASMTGLKKQIEGFAEVYERLGTHLRHAQQNYEDADSKLGRARNAIEQMAQGALPEEPSKVLEAGKD